MNTNQINLTKGKVTSSMMRFAMPMILGNLLQQFYNIADTWVVGRFVGSDALASVGSAYTLMTFVTSILIGLCMGCGALFSFYYGADDKERFGASIQTSFVLVGGFSVVLCILVMSGMNGILDFLNIPDELLVQMYHYVQIVMPGMVFIFLYNFYAYVLRSIGNSKVPLYFLAASSLLNVGLDILFVVGFHWSLEGAGIATLISQILAGVGLMIYAWNLDEQFRIRPSAWSQTDKPYRSIIKYSVSSSLQQSVMNFGILLVQGMVNSFGTAAMAAFAAAVKIDTFAYMPAQEYANAYSIFVSQNFGAGRKAEVSKNCESSENCRNVEDCENHENARNRKNVKNGKNAADAESRRNYDIRIKKGTKSACTISLSFCALVSIVVFIFAKYLLYVFIDPSETEIVSIGIDYLHVEGTFYIGIGLLFLWYAYFRGINRPGMSLVLTIISLGTRVLIAFISTNVPALGLNGIWWAVPIGWFLADVVGFIVYVGSDRRVRSRSLL